MMRKINISLANIQENAENNSKSFYIIRSLQSERCFYMVENQRGMEEPIRPPKSAEGNPGFSPRNCRRGGYVLGDRAQTFIIIHSYFGI